MKNTSFNIGDLVRVPSFDNNMTAWWWEGKLGIITRRAIPWRENDGRISECWHVLVGIRTVNLKETSMKILSKTIK